MPEPKPKLAERNAGAFANPTGIGAGIPIPMSTLSDDYHDEPTEPEDSERVPEPEPPGRIRRLVDRLVHRSNR
jgi:hypothetical protein